MQVVLKSDLITGVSAIGRLRHGTFWGKWLFHESLRPLHPANQHCQREDLPGTLAQLHRRLLGQPATAATPGAVLGTCLQTLRYPTSFVFYSGFSKGDSRGLISLCAVVHQLVQARSGEQADDARLLR